MEAIIVDTKNVKWLSNCCDSPPTDVEALIETGESKCSDCQVIATFYTVPRD